MAELLRDTFTASNQPFGTYDGGAYVSEPGSQNNARIENDALLFDTGGFASTEKWHHGGITIPDGGYVQANWAAVNDGGTAGLILYMDDSNKYMLLHTAGELYLARTRGGSYSVVSARTAPPTPITDGVTVRLQKTGTRIDAFWGDLSTPVYTHDNAQNDFGGAGLMPGLEVVKADLVMDNFIAGDGLPDIASAPPALLSELPVDSVTTVIPKSKTSGTKSPGLGMVDGHTGSAYSPATKKFIALYGSETHNSKNAWNSYFAIDFDQTLAQLNAQLVDDWKTRPWQQWGNDSDYPVAGFGAARNEFRSYLDAGQSGADDTALGPYNPPCHAYHLDEQIVINDLGEELLLSTFSSTAHMFLSTGHDYAPDDSSRFAAGNLGYRIFTESGASNAAQTPIINLSDYSEDSMIVTDAGQHSNADKVISERGRAWVDDRTFYGSDVNNGMVYRATIDVAGNRVTVVDYQSGLTPFGLWPYHEHLKQMVVGDYLTAFYGEVAKGKFFYLAKLDGLSDSSQHLAISLDDLKAQYPILCDDGATSIWDTTATVNYPVTRVGDDCVAMIAYDGTDSGQKTGRLLLWKIPTHDGTSWNGIGEVVDTGLRYDYRKGASNSYQFNITNIRQYADAVYVPFVDKQNDQWDLQIGKLNTDLNTYFGGSQPADTTAPTIELNAPANIQLTVGDTYTAPAVTASDDTDGDLTSSITVTGDDFDTSTPGGPYEVIFAVEDSAPNRASVSQFVTVVASAPALRGVLGSDIPSAGEHGPSILHPYISLPADADKRFYVEPVGALPSGMTLEDSGVLVWDSVASGRTEIPVTLYKDGVEWLPDGRDSIIVITGT